MIYVPGLCYHIIHDKKKEEKKKTHYQSAH